MFKVYSQPNCQACRGTKRLLDRLGAEYEELETISPEARALIEEHGFTAAPIVVSPSGEAWSGYNPAKIKHHAA